MLLKGQSSESKPRRVTPPSPSYMSNDQFASYLASLRTNRVARPGGARPYPGSTSSWRTTTTGNAAVAADGSRAATLGAPVSPVDVASSGHKRTNSDDSKLSSAPSRLAASISSRHSATTHHPGRDYFPEQPTPPLDLGKVVPSATYIERGQRWMEKEEAFSLRHAMEDLDLKKEETCQGDKQAEGDDDEARIHEAALNEAAELVWRHQNGYKAPAPGTPYRYKPHLRKNSYAHARTASVGPHADEVVPTGLGRDLPRSVSGSSSGSDRRVSFEHPARSSLDSAGSRRPRMPASHIAPVKGRRRSSMKRNISGEVERPFSGDQIWEEPDGQSKESVAEDARTMSKEVKTRVGLTDAAAPILKDAPRNPMNKISGGFRQPQAHTSTRRPLPWLAGRKKGVEKMEIHRNPPSQSRNPAYTTNSPIGQKSMGEDKTQVPKKNGMEVRGEDIIEATSRRLKDRSAKLPTPTAVSDSPGRPIVSFNANWKAPEEETDLKIEEAGNGPASLPKQRQHEAVVPSIQMVQASEAVGRASASPSSQLPSIQIRTLPVGVDASPSIRASRSGCSNVRCGVFSRLNSPMPPMTPKSATSDNTIPKISLPTIDDEPPRKHGQLPIPMIVIPGEGDRNNKQDNHSIPSNTRSLPQISVSSEGNGQRASGAPPSIPMIITPDDCSRPSPSLRPLPQISVSLTDGAGGRKLPAAPSVVTLDDRCKQPPFGGSRPLPTPGKRGSPAGMQLPRGHWSPAAIRNPRATATCHECQLPIEGRFVALSGVGERFHPQCFRCYACGTGLEALEISPEPDDKRAERLDRIRRRAKGEILPEEAGKTAAEDGDERLRFFCHLDWHELYAPRCNHCKTPILGEHIVALGDHWHYGHFFCAECGDPFEHGMTHIEKDGYAWCVNCQTKRTERRAPKCKKCKKAVIGQYIRALGGEWHDECFKCATCHGRFDDGQIFPKEQGGDMVVLCTKCRQIELKA